MGVTMVFHSTVGRFDSTSCTLMTTVGPGHQGAHTDMTRSPWDTPSYPLSHCVFFCIYSNISLAVFKVDFAIVDLRFARFPFSSYPLHSGDIPAVFSTPSIYNR
jgi:hypothetical protein